MRPAADIRIRPEQGDWMVMVSKAVSLARVNWWGPGLRFVKGPFLEPFAHQALKESEMILQNREGALITSQGCP